MPRELDAASDSSVAASASNRSTAPSVDDHVGSSSGLTESVDAIDGAEQRRVPVTSPSSLHGHHHRLGVDEVRETLLEWTGDRGKARSVSSAGANLVVFAPLYPAAGGGARRRPEVVKPTPMTQQRSTVPSGLTSLRAIVEKSLGEEASDEETGSAETMNRGADDGAALMTPNVASLGLLMHYLVKA